MSVSEFLVDYAYELIGLLFIALFTGALINYFTQRQWRQVMWCAAFLACCLVIMTALRIDKYFFRTTPSLSPQTIYSPQSQNRPQLSIESVVVQTLEAGKPETIIMEVRNRGKTTARKIKFYSTLVHQPAGADSHLVYSKDPPDVTADLAPDASLTIDFRSKWTNATADIAAMKSGNVVLFLFGKTRYEDDASVPYMDEYCFMYEPPEPRMQFCPSRYVPKEGDPPIPTPTPQPSSASTPLGVAERPRLVVKSVSFTMKAGEPPVAELYFRNEGTALAHNCIAQLTSVISSPEEVRTKMCPEPARKEADTLPSKSIVSVGETRLVRWVSPKPFTQSMIDKLKENKVGLYFWWMGDYSDERGKRYSTEWYGRYDPNNGQFHICPTHNTAN